MADVVKTNSLLDARKEMQKVIDFNSDRPQGQYNYIYVVKQKRGYLVRLSKERPTSKNAMYVKKLHGDSSPLYKKQENTSTGFKWWKL